MHLAGATGSAKLVAQRVGYWDQLKMGGRTLRILDGLLTPRNEQCYEIDCTTARLVVGEKIAHQEAIRFP